MRKNNQGFMMINLVVVIAISAIIAAGAGMTAIQTINVTRSNNDHTTAVRQTQNVGFWISKDILTAQTITTSDDPGTTDVEFIILYWKDWETGDTYDIRYIWLDSADSLKSLKRKVVRCDKDGIETGDISTLIANNVYSANLSLQNGVWHFNVEARSGDRSIIRKYECTQRLEQ